MGSYLNDHAEKEFTTDLSGVLAVAQSGQSLQDEVHGCYIDLFDVFLIKA